jgi:hypothetical protein
VQGASKKPDQFLLTLISDSECQLEFWGAQNNREPFERIFGAPLSVEVESVLRPGAAGQGAAR